MCEAAGVTCGPDPVDSQGPLEASGIVMPPASGYRFTGFTRDLGLDLSPLPAPARGGAEFLEWYNHA